MHAVDIAVIGAGAAGLYCASVAGQRGARVAIIDHSAQLAEKIRISGGGRCNFTNVDADRIERFLGERPRFARDALRACPPRRFIELVRSHGIDYHEKHRGQLFCDGSSESIIAMLRDECDAGGARWLRPVTVQALRRDAAGWVVDTSAGPVSAPRVVIATGGLSIPKIGATDLGFRLARQHGLRVVEPRPGLVPLTFDAQAWQPFSDLSGVALEVDIAIAGDDATTRFREDLLFTHRGLSGPGVLQVSSHWRPGRSLTIDLGGGRDLGAELIAVRDQTRQQLDSVLGTLLPRRLASAWLTQSPHAPLAARKAAELGNKALAGVGQDLRRWQLAPTGTEGYRKAEVTIGGVAVDELDPRTLEAAKAPGLHFIGEVVDITGWLGGYNFQWAWASAFAAAHAMTAGR